MNQQADVQLQPDCGQVRSIIFVARAALWTWWWSSRSSDFVTVCRFRGRCSILGPSMRRFRGRHSTWRSSTCRLRGRHSTWRSLGTSKCTYRSKQAQHYLQDIHASRNPGSAFRMRRLAESGDCALVVVTFRGKRKGNLVFWCFKVDVS